MLPAVAATKAAILLEPLSGAGRLRLPPARGDPRSIGRANERDGIGRFPYRHVLQRRSAHRRSLSVRQPRRLQGRGRLNRALVRSHETGRRHSLAGRPIVLVYLLSLGTCVGAGRKRISRTSPDARQATAPLRAHASASSISAASSIQKPPMCSLVSVYGPSVTSTLPSGWARSDLALLAGERPQANFLAPAGINSRLSACIASIVASVSTDGS